MSRITTEEYIEKARKIYGDKYDYSQIDYTGSKNYITIICPEHGPFSKRPDVFLGGSECPYCSGSKCTTEQFIKKAQSKHGDKYDYSKTQYNGSSKKVLIICPEHGEFLQVANTHLQGKGCPKCADRHIYADDFIRRAESVHGNRYDYSRMNYKSYQDEVRIICPVHGEFWQLPSVHLSGGGCYKCGREISAAKQTLSQEDFIKQSQKVHGERYDYSKVQYEKSDKKVCIICPEHGTFWQTPGSHLQGRGCPKCGRIEAGRKQSHRALDGSIRTSSTEVFIEKARTIHGDKYDYSKVKYINAHTKVTVICPVHGEFEITPNNHLSKHGCSKCACAPMTRDDFIAKAKELHGDRYDYSCVEYTRSTDKVTILCPEHGEFLQEPRIHLSGKGCPACGRAKRCQSANYSEPEQQLYKILLKHFDEDDVIRQYYDKERYPFHCDFYIKTLDLFIELNAYWTHGGHWFDENDTADITRLQEMKEKHSKFYDEAILTWTVRDLEKKTIAENNHLNYLVFWDDDLTDAKQWLKTRKTISNR